MPVWAMIITDVVLTAAAIGVFMLFGLRYAAKFRSKGRSDRNS